MSLFGTQDSRKPLSQTLTKIHHHDQYEEKESFEFLCRVDGDCAKD